MVAACALCQAGSYVTWNQWIVNCTKTDVLLQSLTVPIPSGIAVPAWAYLNVSASGTFDSAAASAIAIASPHVPDVTGNQVPTSIVTTSTTPSSSSSKSKSNTGAIAGGVVGGIVAILLIVLGGLFYCNKRRRLARRRKPSAVVRGLEDQASLAPPMTYIQPAPMKLYDPSDPTTFPPSPGPSFPGSGSLIISPTSATHPPTSYNHSTTHERNLSGSSTTSLPNSNINHSVAGSGSGAPPLPLTVNTGTTSPIHGRNNSGETGYSQAHGRNISGGAPGYTGIAEL